MQNSRFWRAATGAAVVSRAVSLTPTLLSCSVELQAGRPPRPPLPRAPMRPAPGWWTCPTPRRGATPGVVDRHRVPPSLARLWRVGETGARSPPQPCINRPRRTPLGPHTTPRNHISSITRSDIPPLCPPLFVRTHPLPTHPHTVRFTMGLGDNLKVRERTRQPEVVAYFPLWVCRACHICAGKQWCTTWQVRARRLTPCRVYPCSWLFPGSSLLVLYLPLDGQ